MPELPFISFGAGELDDKPIVHAGDEVVCKQCGKKHTLQASTNAETGTPS